MSTPSKFAQEVSEGYTNSDDLLAEFIDRALAPARECLEGLQNSHGCWCHGFEKWEFDPPFTCGPACLAAQQLMERLKIQ